MLCFFLFIGGGGGGKETCAFVKLPRSCCCKSSTSEFSIALSFSLNEFPSKFLSDMIIKLSMAFFACLVFQSMVEIGSRLLTAVFLFLN